MTPIVGIVEKTGDFKAPRDFAELVICPLVTRSRVADGTSEALYVSDIASGVHAMSSDVSNSIQNSILRPKVDVSNDCQLHV